MRTYRLGHSYSDTGSTRRVGDEFLSWINIPGSGMLNSPGIRPLKYASGLHELPAYLILVTHEKTGGPLNPWNDVIDHGAGQIIYWGDAKFHQTKRHNDFIGNKVLDSINNYILDGERNFVPPILHFSKPNRGQIIFNGLCVLERLELSWFDDHGKPVRNFRAHLTILDAEEVSVNWLHERAQAESDRGLDRQAPRVWRQYLRGNTKKLDLWRSKIRSQADQLPIAGSMDADILENLSALASVQFEAVVVALFRQMTDICHSITRTRPTADGGFDFLGSFLLPRPLSYSIEFLGEVKKYSRSTPVQPKDVSRLVARLGRGQYGIFVTTSYYTKQTQKEVCEDAYPLKLVAGIDVVNIMKEQRIISGEGISIKWMKSVLSQLNE